MTQKSTVRGEIVGRRVVQVLIINGVARHHRERHALMASAEEENQRVQCVDDIRRKELPLSEVRQAREQGLDICATLGCTRKSMNVKQSQSLRSFQLTRSGLTQIKAFEVEPMQIKSRIVARQFKRGERQDLYTGTRPLEVLTTIISVAANHIHTSSIMHIDVSRAYFHAKAQILVVARRATEWASTSEKLFF